MFLERSLHIPDDGNSLVSKHSIKQNIVYLVISAMSKVYLHDLIVYECHADLFFFLVVQGFRFPHTRFADSKSFCLLISD